MEVQSPWGIARVMQAWKDLGCSRDRDHIFGQQINHGRNRDLNVNHFITVLIRETEGFF